MVLWVWNRILVLSHLVNIWKFGKIQDCCWAACGGVFSVSLGKHNISHLAFLLKLFSIAPFSNHQKWCKFVHLLYLDKICRGWREKCLWSWNLWELGTIWISWQLSPIKLVLQHTSSASNTFSPNFHKILKSRNSTMCGTEWWERYQLREWWQRWKQKEVSFQNVAHRVFDPSDGGSILKWLVHINDNNSNLAGL